MGVQKLFPKHAVPCSSKATCSCISISSTGISKVRGHRLLEEGLRKFMKVPMDRQYKPSSESSHIDAVFQHLELFRNSMKFLYSQDLRDLSTFAPQNQAIDRWWSMKRDWTNSRTFSRRNDPTSRLPDTRTPEPFRPFCSAISLATFNMCEDLLQ